MSSEIILYSSAYIAVFLRIIYEYTYFKLKHREDITDRGLWEFYSLENHSESL